VAAGTMTGGGFTWTRATSQLWNSTATIYLFWAKTGGAPGSTTITFDCTGDAATGCGMMAFQYTGADLVTPNPLKTALASAGSAADPTITVPAMETNNGYCAGFAIPRNPPVSAPPASWTEIADTGYATPATGGSGAYRAGGETGTTVTFTSASGNWGIVFAEVYVDGAGPLPPSGPPSQPRLALMGVGR
jgi:hypothetical protein